MSSTAPPGKPGVKDRLRDELRKYLWVSAYLYVCFAALMLFEATLVASASGTSVALPHGLALGKALILGKFLLIGEAAHVGERMRARSLLQLIAQRVGLLLVLLIVLTAVEELLVGRAHGHSFAQTLDEFWSQSMPELLAKCLLMLLILVPLVSVTEIGRALGPGRLLRMLRSPPDANTEHPSGQ